MGDITAITKLSDYQVTDGVRQPMSSSQEAAGQKFQVKITKVQYNVDIPEETFKVPDDVKALIEKQKSGGESTKPATGASAK
jgi:hypothetical protein